MKALVVDESAVMRRVLIGALNRANIREVLEAADGDAAVDAVQSEDFAIVLMAWNLPNKLGIDAIREIRAQGKTVPIIMVTSEAEKSRVIEALKAGANNFVIKPFEPQTIVSKIQEVLAKAAAGSSA